MPNYLIYFVHRHFDFRYAELDALLTLQGSSLATILNCSSDIPAILSKLPDPSLSPLLQISLPNDAIAIYLSARGILIKGVYKIWGHAIGHEYCNLIDAIQSSVQSTSSYQSIINDTNISWKIHVDAFGKKLSIQEQRERREQLSAVLPMKGPVILQNPTITFLLLEEREENDPLKDPKQLYFLQELAGSAKNRGRGGARDLIDIQTLKKRQYIGPTAMESEMALLMCNMALVQPGDLVFDPFIGTGSVLVPCGTHGAMCFGTDIDIRVLLGIGVGVTKQVDNITERANVYSNFKQYGLILPELIRADNSRSPIIQRCNEYFDAVVCDPPYGIRAGARKSGRKDGQRVGLKKSGEEVYIPPTQPYAAEDVMTDLLELAAKTLRIGGRLVYLLPTTYEYNEERDVPKHPQLQVLWNSLQPLTQKYARRLITMVKIKANTSETEINAIDKTYTLPGEASFANLREKIVTKKQKIEKIDEKESKV